MQGLWTTAARCRACQRQAWLRSVHLVGRQRTKAAPGPRSVLPNEFLPTCYPRLMTTANAATVDPGDSMEISGNVDELMEQQEEFRRRMKIVRLMELSGAPDLAQIVANSPLYPGMVLASEETTESILERIGGQRLPHREMVFRHLEWSKAATESSRYASALQRSYDSRIEDQRQFDICLAYLRRQETERLRDWPLSYGSQVERAKQTAVALVYALLKQIYKHNPDSRFSPDSAFNAIRMLMSEGYPQYRLQQVDEDTATLTARYQTLRARFASYRRKLQNALNTRSRLAARRKQRIDFREGTSGRGILKLQRRLQWARLRFNSIHRRFSETRQRMNEVLAKLRESRNQAERVELPPEILNARLQLNDANRKVFMNWNSSRKKRSVAKLCYNILVSPYPPGVNNYNMMLLHLSKLGEFDLAQVIADRCLSWNHRLPGGGTLLCLLYHYRQKGVYTDYLKLLRQITGRNNDGWIVQPRSFLAVRRERQFQLWAEKYAVSLSRGIIMERHDLEAVHLDFIIQGLLDLGQGRAAASLYIACLREDLQIPAQTRERLVVRFLSSLDAVSARIFVDGFLSNIRDYGYLWHNTSKTHARLHSGEAEMIRESRIRGDEFRRLLNIACARPFHLGASYEAYERGYGIRVPVVGLERSLLSHKVQYLAMLAWLEWLLQHLRRVDAILQHARAVLAEPRISDKGLLSLNSRMAEEQRFLEMQAWINNETRELAWERWVDGEVHSSSISVRKLKREMMNILFGEGFWGTVGLLDTPYKRVIALFEELQDPLSPSNRVVCRIDQVNAARSEYRKLLVELLDVLEPKVPPGVRYKRNSKPTDELVALTSNILWRKVKRARNKRRKTLSIMERIRSWVPRIW